LNIIIPKNNDEKITNPINILIITGFIGFSAIIIDLSVLIVLRIIIFYVLQVGKRSSNYYPIIVI